MLATVGGAVLYVAALDEDCDKEIANLKMVTDNTVKQALDLSQEYNKASNDLALFNEIKKKRDNKLLAISKLALKSVISGARSKYILDSLDVKMEEPKVMEGPEYKKESLAIESGNVTIGLNALTDLDVLGLIQAMDKEFWGIKFTSVKISLEKELDAASIIAIKDTGFTPIVNAKLTFTLFGLRNIASIADSLTEGDGMKKPDGVNVPAGLKP